VSFDLRGSTRIGSACWGYSSCSTAGFFEHGCWQKTADAAGPSAFGLELIAPGEAIRTIMIPEGAIPADSVNDGFSWFALGLKSEGIYVRLFSLTGVADVRPEG